MSERKGLKYKKNESKKNYTNLYLPKEEEQKIGEVIYRYKQTQDESLLEEAKKAVETLYFHNEKYAYKIAHNFMRHVKPENYSLDEALQDARTGLIIALWRYNPYKNARVSTIAYFSIFKELSEQTNRARQIPYKGYYHIQKSRAEEEYSKIENPTQTLEEYIIENTDLSKEELYSINNISRGVTSFEYELPDGHYLRDYIVDSKADYWSQNEEISSPLLDFVNKLDDEIIRKCTLYYFSDSVAIPEEEFASSLNLTIRQYRNRARKGIKLLKEIANKENITLNSFVS